MSVPQSTIYLCAGVRLNNSYQHTIYFESQEKQLAYFMSKKVDIRSQYTYLRKSWSIKVTATMSQAEKWGYLFFVNSSKYYFYFITNVEYISDNTVELFLELDVMQTYMFDYELTPCFVEREHASVDTVGENTVEESLDVGDLIINDQNNVTELSELCILVMSTYNPLTTGEENTDTVLASRYNGVFGGLGIYAVDMSQWDAWGAKLNLLDTYGKSDGIITMWMYPKNLVQLADGESWTNTTVTHRVKGVQGLNKVFTRPETIDGYTPKNKKLLTYPYSFLYLSNNLGNAASYRYERFEFPSTCDFKIVGALSPDGSVVMYPINYNGYILNYEEGLTLGNFPTCAWNQDVYKLWLAQNQNSMSLGLALSGLSVIGGAVATVATGGAGAMAGVGAMAGGITNIAQILANKADRAIQPPQAKGNHSASVNVANGWQNFTMQSKSITAKQAQIIDDYFSMFGYATRRVKVPNTNVRENWTYTKTQNCNVYGDFSREDIAKIESIYNNGVTFWMNGDNVGDYSLTNNTL